MALDLIVKEINQVLYSKLFNQERFIAAELFGVAEPGVYPDSNRIFPVIYLSDRKEYKYVGIEDLKSIIVYHKVSSAALTALEQGYGDARYKRKLRYSMTMLVFIDTFKTKMPADELFLYIQSVMPEKVKIPNFDYISISIGSVILNNRQVFSGEYSNVPYFPKPEHSLMAINYQIESEFKAACFNVCPEV